MDVTRNRKRIGELLRDTGLINNNHLDIAIKYQNATHEKLASILFQMGAVDEKSIASLLEKQLNTKTHSLIPIELDSNTLTLAMTDPNDVKTIDEIAFRLNVKVKPVIALEYSIKVALMKYYKDITFTLPEIPKFSDDQSPETMEIERQESFTRNTQYSSETVMEALTEILIEKNIISRPELIGMIRKKARVTKSGDEPSDQEQNGTS
jgi:type IV pilus assembly protein PilB